MMNEIKTKNTAVKPMKRLVLDREGSKVEKAISVLFDVRSDNENR